jgi:hypothetical protein
MIQDPKSLQIEIKEDLYRTEVHFTNSEGILVFKVQVINGHTLSLSSPVEGFITDRNTRYGGTLSVRPQGHNSLYVERLPYVDRDW